LTAARGESLGFLVEMMTLSQTAAKITTVSKSSGLSMLV